MKLLQRVDIISWCRIYRMITTQQESFNLTSIWRRHSLAKAQTITCTAFRIFSRESITAEPSWVISHWTNPFENSIFISQLSYAALPAPLKLHMKLSHITMKRRHKEHNPCMSLRVALLSQGVNTKWIKFSTIVYMSLNLINSNAAPSLEHNPVCIRRYQSGQTLSSPFLSNMT